MHSAGLDTLARQKRAEKREPEESESAKRVKLSIAAADDEEPAADAEGNFDRSAAAPTAFKRQIRGQRIETPSHGGGVASGLQEERRERERERRDRDGALYASTAQDRDRYAPLCILCPLCSGDFYRSIYYFYLCLLSLCCVGRLVGSNCPPPVRVSPLLFRFLPIW